MSGKYEVHIIYWVPSLASHIHLMHLLHCLPCEVTVYLAIFNIMPRFESSYSVPGRLASYRKSDKTVGVNIFSLLGLTRTGTDQQKLKQENLGGLEQE